MTDTAFAPAKLPVIATFKKTCRAFLKALGPLVLLMLLLIGVLVAGMVALTIPVGGLGFLLWRGLGLELGTIPFMLAMAPVILGAIGLLVAVSMRFSIAQYKISDASADGLNLNFMDVLRDPKPSILRYFLLGIVITILIILIPLLVFWLGIGFVYAISLDVSLNPSRQYIIGSIWIISVVVPGIMIALALWLAPLAMIFEGKGVSESIQRSRDLTRDNRWRLLGLYVLSALIFLPASLLTSLPLESDPEVAFSPLRGLLVILNVAVSILQAIFLVVLTVTIYRELRALKDRPAEVVAPEPAPEPLPAA